MTRKKFDIIKLQQPAIKAHLSLKLCNKYDILQDYNETDDEEVKKQWQDFEDAYKKNSSRSSGAQKESAKTMDQQGAMGVSRREKMTEEQNRADKVRQD